MRKNKEIYCGDCLGILKKFPDNFIDCVMTSPPYWALRDYGVDKQLGLEVNFNDYIKKLCDIFDEVKRTLKNTGTCWVNLGDTYSGNKEGKTDKKVSDYLKNTTINLHKKTSGITEKSLCNIPARFSIEMQNRGWILRNVIIWHKPNCMPTSVKDRFTVDFEYLFFFVKSKKYYFEQQREPHKEESKKRTEYNWNGHREIGSSYFGMDIKKMCHPDGRNKRCVWAITTKGFRGAHFAVYPEELCNIPIKAGCSENGIVLDPFCGSGTTGVVCKKLNRKFLGIDINPNYCKIAESRISETQNG